MADIVTNTLQIGNDKLILRDADAQEKVTGLKEDLENITDTDIVTWIPKRRIVTNANPVPLDGEANNNWLCAVVDCSEGDVFTLTGASNTSEARIYCFCTDTGNIIESASQNYTWVNHEIVAPVGATKLVCNTIYTVPYFLFKGRTVSAINKDIDTEFSKIETNVVNVNDIIGDVSGVTPCGFWSAGAVNTNVSTIDISNINPRTLDTWYHLICECKPGDLFNVKVGPGNSTARPYAFLDSSGTVLEVADVNTIEEKKTAPENAAYLLCNVQYNQPNAVYKVYKGKNNIETLEDKVDGLVGLDYYSFIPGRITVNVDPIDITDVAVKNGWFYCVVDCSEGDVFNIKVPSATVQWRPWTFIDSDGHVLSQAKQNVVNTYLVAPPLASKLVCNSYGNATLSKGIFKPSEWVDYSRYIGLLGAFHSIGVVGDSLASGQGRVNDLEHYNDFYDYSWPQVIKRRLGVNVYNFTKSGLSTKTWLTDAHGWSMASDPQYKSQCYIIGLGANDTGRVESDPAYLGEPSDIHINDYTLNPDTYYGNYGRIISMLKTIEPRAVFFVLPNPVYGSTPTVRTQMNEAVKYMATAFDNVYFVDLNTELYSGGYIQKNEVKSHYTPGAYIYMAEIIMSGIAKVMYYKPEDFFFVNLIGTEYSTPSLT